MGDAYSLEIVKREGDTEAVSVLMTDREGEVVMYSFCWITCTLTYGWVDDIKVGYVGTYAGGIMLLVFWMVVVVNGAL